MCLTLMVDHMLDLKICICNPAMSLTLMVDQLSRFKATYIQPSNEPDTDGWPTFSIYSYVYATQQWAWHWWLTNLLDLKLRICNPARHSEVPSQLPFVCFHVASSSHSCFSLNSSSLFTLAMHSQMMHCQDLQLGAWSCQASVRPHLWRSQDQVIPQHLISWDRQSVVFTWNRGNGEF